MERDAVQVWLDRYVEAWRTNDRDDVEALFTPDATYRYRPYGGEAHAAVGIEDIVRAWMDEDDPPGSWQAAYQPYSVEGDRAVATGTSDYFASDQGPARRYHNVFLLRFAPDGRCLEFTEYYMLEEPS